MRQKTKITITALAVMLFMALAVTIISFSFADDSNTTAGTTTADSTTDTTNIDYIIRNSNDTDLSALNRKYRIVEIGAGEKSSISDFVSSKGFEQYVINGNKTIADEFATGNVKYNYFNASEVSSVSTNSGETDEEGNKILDYTIISQADMIYISNYNGGSSGGYNTGYSTASGNDLSDELYSLIQPMAVGDYIPIIIDIPSQSGSNTPDSVIKAVDTCVGNIVADSYVADGKYYYTFGYDTSWDASTYFDTSIGSKASYLSINAKDRSEAGYYTTVKTSETSSDTYTMAKMLVISQSGTALSSSTSAVSKLVDLTKQESNLVAIEEVEEQVTNPETGEVTTETATKTTAVEGNVYNITGTALYTSGYNTRYNIFNPTYVQLEEKTVSQLTDVASLDEYDMVFIEADTKDVVLNTTSDPDGKIKTLLESAMVGNVHITYDVDAAKYDTTDSEITDGNGNANEADGTNYAKFYNYVSSNGIASYENIMLTNKASIDLITTAKTAATSKTIAELINNSSYRGIGGPKSTSSKFSVLEIEPCYPIDTDIVASNLAAGKEGYYNDATNIMNGMSKEEIETQLGLTSDTQSSTTYEYYAWELSKAKIAEALGVNANNITLTQMSTEELASYKGEILGNYDLVYIGGNTSALKSAEDYISYLSITKNGATVSIYNRLVANMHLEAGTAEFNKRLTSLPIYTMYSHNGDLISTTSISGAHSVALGSASVLGTTLNSVSYSSEAFTQLNGNDITSLNLTKLEAYVDAGMPILFSTDLSRAYGTILKNYNDALAKEGATAESAQSAKYAQNSLDPDSNMCKFLEYCYNKQNFKIDVDNGNILVSDGSGNYVDFNSNSSIMWNFNATENTRTVENENGKYSLYSNTVTVLAETVRNNLATVYKNSSKRPKLVVTRKPEQYSLNSESSITNSSTLKFVIDESMVKKSTSSYTLNLYIDDDGNSVFESGEKIASVSNNAEISSPLADDFSGPVYWKLELVDESSNSKPTVMQTGLAYVKPSKTSKQQVTLLQILPGHRVLGGFASGIEGATGSANGLYFCTVCQQSTKIDYYNPHSTTNFGVTKFYYSGLYTDCSADNTNVTMSNLGVANYTTRKNGLHEHNFGIVSYDSSLKITGDQGTYTGTDDWNHNLADDLSDYFDFDVQILYADDYERYAEEIAAAYSGLTTEKQISDKMKEYQDKATETYALYKDKKEEVDEIETEMNELLDYLIQCIKDKVSTTYCYDADGWNGTWQDVDDDTKISTLETIKKEGTYSLFFCVANGDVSAAYPNVMVNGVLNGLPWGSSSVPSDAKTYTSFLELYNRWVTVHDEMLLLKGGYYVNEYTYPYFTQMKQYTEADNKSYYDAYSESGMDDGGTTSCPRIFGYQDYEKFAAGVSWLKSCYTSVCIGPSENFGNDDIDSQEGLDALVQYVNDGGQLILFHDTFSGSDSSGSINLTKTLRTLAGADKYHVDVNNADTSSTYTKFTTTDSEKYPSSIYFNTNLTNDTSDTKYTGFSSYVESMLSSTNLGGDPTRRYTVTGLTDGYMSSSNGMDSERANLDMYKYAEMNWTAAANYNYNYAVGKAGLTYGTDRASKNNDAIVTMFPFSLADEIYIGGTHPQALALDVDNEDLTVLYSLAGGTSGHNMTSEFAADPGDGSDNYFIYSCNNIYYCGAGHGFITGIEKDNLNERYLYMNIICNSVRQSAIVPTISVYDDSSTESSLTNNVVKKQSDGSYVYQLDEDAYYPSFSFKVGVDDNATLSKVEVYYDLDYGQIQRRKVPQTDEEGNVVTDANGNIQYKYATDENGDLIEAKDESGKVITDANGNPTYEYEYVELSNSNEYSDGDVLIASWGPSGTTTDTSKKTFAASVLGHICVDNSADPNEVDSDSKHPSTSHGSASSLEKYTVNNVVDKVTNTFSALRIRKGDTSTYGEDEPDYFGAYDGNYTYIVIKVTDSNGSVMYKRIKITRKSKLFNLT